MDSIRIDTGEKHICINDDPNRVLVFNPADILFAEKFYALLSELEKKITEYQERGTQLDRENGQDQHGLPMNLSARVAFMRESCEYIRGQIDYLFGVGTSKLVFGDAMSLDMFTQFFQGVTPFIQTSRTEKVSKYIPQAGKKRVLK